MDIKKGGQTSSRRHLPQTRRPHRLQNSTTKIFLTTQTFTVQYARRRIENPGGDSCTHPLKRLPANAPLAPIPRNPQPIFISKFFSCPPETPSRHTPRANPKVPGGTKAKRSGSQRIEVESTPQKPPSIPQNLRFYPQNAFSPRKIARNSLFFVRTAAILAPRCRLEACVTW